MKLRACGQRSQDLHQDIKTLEGYFGTFQFDGPTWKFRTPSQQLVWSGIAFRSSIPNWKVKQIRESTATLWSRAGHAATYLHVDAVLEAALGLGLHQPVAGLWRLTCICSLLRSSRYFPFATSRGFRRRDLFTLIGLGWWGKDHHSLWCNRKKMFPFVNLLTWICSFFTHSGPFLWRHLSFTTKNIMNNM